MPKCPTCGNKFAKTRETLVSEITNQDNVDHFLSIAKVLFIKNSQMVVLQLMPFYNHNITD